MTKTVTCLCLFLVSTAQAASPITLDDLKERQRQMREVYKKGLEATVCVRPAKGSGSGSGVIISKDGLVMTAAHVIDAAGQELILQFYDGREVKAKALGADNNRDAGMIQITEKGTYPYVEIGRSGTLKPNQWCVSMGHPGGFDITRPPPLRVGRVLGNDKWVTTNCTLIGGDSGGPLFDLDARVIGIHSNIGGLMENNHVPADVFHDGWDRMKSSETWGKMGAAPGASDNRPVLGAQYEADATGGGARISYIHPHSPAARAGLQVGDVIVRAGKTTIETPETMLDLVQNSKPPAEIELEVRRGEETRTLTANIITMKEMRKILREKLHKERMGESGAPPEPRVRSSEGPLLSDLLARSKSNDGRLRLDRDKLRALRERMAKRMQKSAPAGSGRLRDDMMLDLFRAHEPIIHTPAAATKRVLVSGQQVALATAIRKDGLLLTKASEVEGKEFLIELAKDRRLPGEVLKTYDDHDLALVRVDASDLPTVTPTHESASLLPGMLCAAVGHTSEPTGIGAVSVKPRNLSRKWDDLLGFVPGSNEQGVTVSRVSPGSPAAKGGLRKDDLILSVNGKPCSKVNELASALARNGPGSRIHLIVKRNEAELSVPLKFPEDNSVAQMPSSGMDRMTGGVSKRNSGFRLAIQHDCPIRPRDCGGPLIDLEGRVIGINVARAGRIKTYAVPASELISLIQKIEE